MRLKYSNYSVHRGVQHIKTKVTLVVTAFALALTGGSGIALLSTQVASAAPGVVYSSVPFTNLNLVTDRSAPSGGSTIAPNLLTEKVDNTNSNPLGGFYTTEGLQGTISTSQSIRSELYVDQAWSGKQIRAGLWGIAASDTASDVAWPIIEYTTVGDEGFIGWRVFDTMNGGWTNLPGVTATAGSWYKLEIAFNTLTKNYDYFVNDSYVKSLPASFDTDTYGKLNGVIFNNKNFVTNDHSGDYTVQWRNFQRGSYLADKTVCMNNGWKNYASAFKNQGDCVSWVQHNVNGNGVPAKER